MIRNIIFDLGGVLLNIDIQRTVSALQLLGFPPQELAFGLGHAGGVFKKYEAGQISDAAFVNALLEKLDKGVHPEQVIEAWNALLLNFPPERISFLEELKSRYRLFLFSNTNNLHLEAFQQQFSQAFNGRRLDDLFEKAYYSHQVRIRKPDAAAFQLVMDENGLTPGETLFVDDAEINLEGARSVGLRAFHIHGGNSILDLPL